MSEQQIIEIDADGEVVTAYIFADNYFEMYINGIAVGKDPVPFTKFNSNIVQFKVKKPFDIAILAVDWEENLGTGTESNRGASAHPAMVVWLLYLKMQIIRQSLSLIALGKHKTITPLLFLI
ncbi:hypothetical protein [Psychromonas sp. KJ10-2]|uniref:hypothetical protein n=1 Tax=Psychromonas sp. KJ10-2 TaxID=3391822 RepID=UPI0039B3F304